MKVYIGCDHRGVEVENEIAKVLEQSYEVIRTKLPHYDTDDYVDFALEVCHNVKRENDSLGILMCGTGIGMSIIANKVKGIRAAHCVDTNQAMLAKQHNGANIICLATEDVDKMLEIINAFLVTPTASEDKHLKRINKIIKYENGEYNEL